MVYTKSMRLLSFFLTIALSFTAFCPMTFAAHMADRNGGEVEMETQPECLTSQCFIKPSERIPVFTFNFYPLIPDAPVRELVSVVPVPTAAESLEGVHYPINSPPTKTVVLRL